MRAEKETIGGSREVRLSKARTNIHVLVAIRFPHAVFTIPARLGDRKKRRLQAEGVVASVAVVTQEHAVGVVSLSAQVTGRVRVFLKCANLQIEREIRGEHT